MDVGTHFRAIWHRRCGVLGGALIVGLAVLLLNLAIPATYRASAVLFVVPSGVGDPTAEVTRLAAVYTDLAGDPSVLTAGVAARSGVTVSELPSRTSVTVGGQGQMTVTASGGSAEAAAGLANALARSLTAAADQRGAESATRALEPMQQELAALDTQIAAGGDPAGVDQLTQRRNAVSQARLEQLRTPRGRLEVVTAARGEGADRSPNAVRNALLAFLLAAILLAELAALLAARRQGLNGQDPVPTLREWTDLPVFRIGSSQRSADQSSVALLHISAEGKDNGLAPVVSLACLASPASSDFVVRQMLVTSAAWYGQTTLVDLRADDGLSGGKAYPDTVRVVRPSVAEVRYYSRDSAELTVSSPFTVVVADRWEQPGFLLLSEALHSQVFLVEDAKTVRRRELMLTVQTMLDAGRAAAGIFVAESTGGRVTRAYSWRSPLVVGSRGQPKQGAWRTFTSAMSGRRSAGSTGEAAGARGAIPKAGREPQGVTSPVSQDPS